MFDISVSMVVSKGSINSTSHRTKQKETKQQDIYTQSDLKLMACIKSFGLFPVVYACQYGARWLTVLLVVVEVLKVLIEITLGKGIYQDLNDLLTAASLGHRLVSKILIKENLKWKCTI